MCILLIAILYWFFGTELGSAIRATGNNEKMIRAMYMEMGRKPSEAQIKRIMASVKSQYK